MPFTVLGSNNTEVYTSLPLSTSCSMGDTQDIGRKKATVCPDSLIIINAYFIPLKKIMLLLWWNHAQIFSFFFSLFLSFSFFLPSFPFSLHSFFPPFLQSLPALCNIEVTSHIWLLSMWNVASPNWHIW